MNDYASQQRNPRKHVVGLSLVVLLHALLFWGINSGLARKFVKVIRGPVETQLLEDAKPDLPPPPPPPPPKTAPPPPAYVPPAETVVNAAPSANAIAAVSNTPAPPPPPPAPPAPPSPPPAPPAPPVRTPAVINAAVNCEKPAYPAASRRAEEEGTVQLRFQIDVDGRVIDSQIESSSGFKRLDEAARSALSRCQFKPATLDGRPEQSWASMKYTWRLE